MNLFLIQLVWKLHWFRTIHFVITSFLSLQNGLSVWFTRLHNHGEDCWSDSCPEDNFDTLHKEGKPQTFIVKEAGCSQSAVSKHVNRKLSGRKKCGRKRCTTNRENRSLMRIVKQNRFKNLGELHKEWTEAGVKASRATTHRRVKEFGYSCHQRRLTWAKEKKNWTVAQWSKVLFSDESKFCISFGNQGPRVWRKGGEAHSPSCLKSSVKFPQSVMIGGAMSSAGVGPLCFLKTNVTSPVYQYILEHFMLPSANQLFEDADFIFQQDLTPAHTAKCTKSWLNDHGVWCAWLASKLPRPEPHRESMVLQEENEKQETKKCRWAEGQCQRNLGFHTTSAVPQTFGYDWNLGSLKREWTLH